MKKILVVTFSFFSLLSVSAQTKITKASVVGKWSLSEVEMAGMFYYNRDKDSLALGEMAKAQMKEESQQAAMIAMIKPQLTMFAKVSYEFKSDNTAIMNSGIIAPQNGTYSVDEENSTITTTAKDDKKATMKADMIYDKLRVKLDSPQGEIVMTLTKDK